MVCKTITFTEDGGQVTEGKPTDQLIQPTLNKRNLVVAGAAVAGLAYAATR
jgi:hypothetical protein